MFLTKTSERMYEIYDMILGPGRKFHPDFTRDPSGALPPSDYQHEISIGIGREIGPDSPPSNAGCHNSHESFLEEM